MHWLSDNLKQRIRQEFEKDYKKKLTDEEVITIANNLTEFMEAYIKFKLKHNEKVHA